MTERISSLDSGYTTGSLSLFPDVVDDKESLYEVRNNAETKIRATVAFNAKQIIVEDTSSFPPTGLLRLGPPPGTPGEAELVYYATKTNNVFKNLVRGFAGSRQNRWNAGSYVSNAVMAEAHNSIKDAIINIQTKIGKLKEPDEASLHGLLKALEYRYLAPKAQFKAFPRRGAPALTVKFQSLSDGDIIRYLWDFGDGSQSIDKNPSHTYQSEGFYTVKLTVITSTGSQGIATKSNYVKVSDDERLPFFYVTQADSTNPPYSEQTADENSAEPAVWNFVDQTDGDITQRFWVFGDGTTSTVTDASVHTTTHVYAEPGLYEPSLIIVFAGEQTKRVFLEERITVL